jgi:hypothetical protein
MNSVKRRYSLSWWGWTALVVAAGAVIASAAFVYPFLSVTERVDADILVVEGWIPDYMLQPVVNEFYQGQYSVLLVSGLQNESGVDQAASISEVTRTATRLEQLGVPNHALVPCPAPIASWLRTSKSARAVQHKIVELGIKPKGINVITAGPHARETWVAYQHVFGPEMPVGIIAVPRSEYPANRWWLNRHGLYWVAKDIPAWLKELVFGLRG